MGHPLRSIRTSSPEGKFHFSRHTGLSSRHLPRGKFAVSPSPLKRAAYLLRLVCCRIQYERKRCSRRPCFYPCRTCSGRSFRVSCLGVEVLCIPPPRSRSRHRFIRADGGIAQVGCSQPWCGHAADTMRPSRFQERCGTSESADREK